MATPFTELILPGTTAAAGLQPVQSPHEPAVDPGIGAQVITAGARGRAQAIEIGTRLQRVVHRIDLQQFVSKYREETEKRLALLIDKAEQSGAILFFDEADALFGKRSEVKDAHDRYANIEDPARKKRTDVEDSHDRFANFAASWLLERIREYKGTVLVSRNEP